MNSASASQMKKDYFWNTLASTMNALSSVILLLVVTQTMGVYAGGLFSIAYAISQQFLVLGHFEMRPLQATDLQEKYSFGEYYASRILTCALMLACIVAYAFLSASNGPEGFVLVLVALMKFFDAFEDVFHGMFQQQGRLDIAGRAFFYRVLVTTVVFSVSAFIVRDLSIACLITLSLSLVALVVLNYPPARDFVRVVPCFHGRQIAALLWSCVPLFIGSFLLAYIANAPRYGIESFLSKEAQTYYAVIFMPALVINLLSGFIFKPLLTTLAKRWMDGDVAGFMSIIAKGVGLVFAITAACVVVAYFIGIPILSWLYGVDLGGLRPELLLLLVGGACNAMGVILYYALVTMRCQNYVMLAYGIAAAAAYGLTQMLIPQFGLMGAVMSYDGTMLILALVFLCLVVSFLSRARRRHASLQQ